MSDNTLNPILDPDCECPEVVQPVPTDCPDTEAVTFDIDVTPEECGVCDEIIVPAPPMIPDVVVTKECRSADPAYSYIPAIDKTPGVGGAHYFYELHPACVRPMLNCTFCIENNICPEDIGLTYRKGDDNVYSAMPQGAVQPLLFFVHDSHKDRVLSEIGYVKVAQNGNFNEWQPRDCVSNGYVISPSVAFPGDDCFLQTRELGGNLPQIGTLPTVVTSMPVTSVTDPDTVAPTVTTVADPNSTSGAAITPVQLVADEAIVTWVATPLPAGLMLDPATGLITGTPTTAGVTSVVVTGTDAAGNVSAPATITWTVV